MRRMRFHASILLIFPARSPVSRRPLLARPGLRRGGKPVVLVQMDCVGLGTRRHGGAIPASSSVVLKGTFTVIFPRSGDRRCQMEATDDVRFDPRTKTIQPETGWARAGGEWRVGKVIIINFGWGRTGVVTWGKKGRFAGRLLACLLACFKISWPLQPQPKKAQHSMNCGIIY